MKNSPTAKTNTTSYLEGVTYGVIAFADQDEVFRTWLLSRLPHVTDITTTLYTQKPFHPIYTVPDAHTALRRSEWLLETLETKHENQQQHLLSVLTQWANEQGKTNPSVIVLGLKYGVLNYGIFGHPKRRFEPLNIIVRDDVAQSVNKAALGKLSVTLSHEILQISLLRNNGNIELLEPELSDWFFGDKTIVYKCGDKEILNTLASILRKNDAPHITRNDSKGITAIAIHPSVYLEDIPEADILTSLS